MMGIHNVFPADEINDNDPISKKKLKQLGGECSTKKTILSQVLSRSGTPGIYFLVISGVLFPTSLLSFTLLLYDFLRGLV